MMTDIRDRILGNDRRAGSAELALRTHGFTGERLLKLAHKVANDELRKRNDARLKDRYEDLVQSLVEVGCRYAPRYDPQLATDTYERYLAKHMAHRVDDFFRSKAQGFGDRRYGNDNRVDLVDDPDPADHDVDFDRLLTDRRRAQWQTAADLMQLNLAEWMCATLDRGSTHVIEQHKTAA